MEEYTEHYAIIKRLHELTNEYFSLEDDALWNAGAFARLEREIEDLAMDMSRINTDLTDEQLRSYLTKHYRRD